MADLIEHLQEAGYEPQDTTSGEGDWFDLVASGTGMVRACVYPRDDYSAEVYFTDRHLCTEWQAKFSAGTPDAVIIAVLEAAEWQLAARRGGPVTPMQDAIASGGEEEADGHGRL